MSFTGGWIDPVESTTQNSESTILGLISNLKILLECEPNSVRLSWINQLDSVLPDSAKIERACALIDQVRVNRMSTTEIDGDDEINFSSQVRSEHEAKQQYLSGDDELLGGHPETQMHGNTDERHTQIENQRTQSVKRMVESMGNDACRIMGACFGPSVEEFEAGMMEVFQRKRSTLGVVVLNSKEIQLLQQQYTRVAAELMLRWNLTTRQYMEGRKLIVNNPQSASNSASEELTVMTEQEPGLVVQKKRKRKRKALPLESQSLSKRTAGIEFLPSLSNVNRVLPLVKSTITLPPRNVRERLPDGRFRWVKEAPSSRTVRRRVPNESGQVSMRNVISTVDQVRQVETSQTLHDKMMDIRPLDQPELGEEKINSAY